MIDESTEWMLMIDERFRDCSEFLLTCRVCSGFRHEVAAIPAQQHVACTSLALHKDRLVRFASALMLSAPALSPLNSNG